MDAVHNHAAVIAAADRVAAVYAGLSPPPGNGDARELGSVAGVGHHGKANASDFEAQRAADQVVRIAAKKFATLRAQLALAGWALIRSDATDGPVTFYAIRLGMVHALRDLVAVESFNEHLGRAR